MSKIRNRVLMVGVDDLTFGGMTAVQQSYRKHWDYDQYDLRYIGVFRDGSAPTKLVIALRGLLIYLWYMLTWHPDLIHVHFSWRGSVYRKSVFMLIGRLMGRVVIGHAHAYEFERFYQSQPSVARAYIRFVFRQLSHLIVLSPSWQQYYQKFVPQERITIIYNPAEVSAHPTFERQHANILFLGELGERKGVYDLLRVMPTIIQAHPDVHLYLCGNGALKQVNDMVHQLGLESQVTVTGWVSGDDKSRYLQQAMIFVLPSHNEGLPVAVIEAMTHGIAVITTPVGGIPDIFTDGEHLLLVDVQHQAQLEHAMLTLLEDADLRQQLAQEAYDFSIATFSPMVILREVYALYRRFAIGSEHPNRDVPAAK